MKKRFVLIIFTLVFILFSNSLMAQRKGSCTGKKSCRVCTNCTRCKYCGKKKGYNCGVCNKRMR